VINHQQKEKWTGRPGNPLSHSRTNIICELALVAVTVRVVLKVKSESSAGTCARKVRAGTRGGQGQGNLGQRDRHDGHKGGRGWEGEGRRARTDADGTLMVV
jgi:hypothetical protein